MEDRPGREPVSGDEIRAASFPTVRKGYDRGAVHQFLSRLADWVDENGDGSGAGSKLTSEFARVGERTAGILTAAEAAATKLRREAQEEAEKLRSEAKEHAKRLRASAEEEARKAKLNASQKADELLAGAESRADRMIEEAVARRRRLNEAVSSLAERRDEIADEAQQLAQELLEMVESLRKREAVDELPGTAALQ